MRRLILIPVIAVGLLLFALLRIPAAAAQAYGPPAPGLSSMQVLEYSGKLLWDDGLLTKGRDPSAEQQSFKVQQGEPLPSVLNRLQNVGLISDASMLRDYLVYSGLDTSVQAGDYKLSAAMSMVDIARQMQDANPTEVTFVILPGWRIEEIAASLATSGLNISAEEFIAAASAPHGGFDFLSDAASSEGFLFPDSYILPRSATTGQLLDTLLRNFSQHVGMDLRDGFGRQGLSVYEAVTLASIVQREAVHDDEAPTIASVYLNRLKNGTRLEADPTVQYALGYDSASGTWWTNPLSLADLKVESAFNTYVNDGLPPRPIDNPGLTALWAVASPADASYFYFSARCDGSGYHNFATTFEEHLGNLCP